MATSDLGWEHWGTQSQVTLGEPKDQSVLRGRLARITYKVSERILGTRTGVSLSGWSIACLLSLMAFLTLWKITVCALLSPNSHLGPCPRREQQP